MVVKRYMLAVAGTMAFTVCSLGGLLSASLSSATEPWWHLMSGSRPTYLQPEGKGEVVVLATNLGNGVVDGEASAVTVEDTLPEHFKVLAASGLAGETGGGTRGPVKCGKAGSVVACVFGGTLPPFDEIEVRIKVEVLPEASSGELNELTVSGGGAAVASLSRPLTVTEGLAPFGIEDYELSNEEVGGALTTQAGSHPFQQTTTIALNQLAATAIDQRYAAPTVDLAKDVYFHWPPGLLGNPTQIPRCSLGQFLTAVPEPGTNTDANACPPQTAVGVSMVRSMNPSLLGWIR